MGKTKRDILKRKIAQSHYSLDKALIPIADLDDTFRPYHPDLADGLIAAAQLIADAQKCLELFALVAWNMDKDTFESYRGYN